MDGEDDSLFPPGVNVCTSSSCSANHIQSPVAAYLLSNLNLHHSAALITHYLQNAHFPLLDFATYYLNMKDKHNLWCPVCSKAASLACALCKKQHYCGKSCQKQHKETHTKKQMCIPDANALEVKSIWGASGSVLIPGPITNSGIADGGWMDRVGISRVGTQARKFSGPNLFDAFYSNRAYEATGFCTIELDALPIDGDNLVESLKEHTYGIESDRYREGKAEFISIEPIKDPKAIGSSATAIVHHHYHVPVTPSEFTPSNLHADKIVAMLRFDEKADVFLTIANWESENLDYLKILGSIKYMGDELK